MAETQQTVDFGGWPNCLRLANEHVELIATTDVGPRIVHLGFVGGPNEFREFPEQQGIFEGDEWHVFGGHRLWHAPEEKPRSYQPDNEPVTCELVPHGIVLQQRTERRTNIQKGMHVELREGAHVVVTHWLANRGAWPVTLAPWALSVMAPGGTAIIPQPPLGTSDQLLPNRTLTLWPYTRLNDPRLLWGETYLRVQPNPATEAPTKIGTQASEGWCAYANGGRLFLKRVQNQPDVLYPDLNSGIEVYTAGDFLELETLAPLTELHPDGVAFHEEHWFLFDGADASSEEALNRTVLPRIDETDGLLTSA